MDNQSEIDLAALRQIDNLAALYHATDQQNLTPGWVPRSVPIMWPAPHSQYLPALWRYDAARATLAAAGRLVDVTLAERRNFVMRNPAPATNFESTRTQVCAYQLILPGEAAPSHRHSSHALRVIIDAVGSYSIVDGVRTSMETGDVVLTPGGCWHGHGHDGDAPATWLDVLDVPFTHLTEAMFYEHHPAGVEPVIAVAEESPFRFSHAAIERGLDRAPPDPDGAHGPRITLPTPAMPGMELFVERLPAGHATRALRSTANRVFSVMQGEGESAIDGQIFAWRRGDTFVVPCWCEFHHRAASDAVLFTCSDEPVLRFTKYLYVGGADPKPR
jgi:gentisate 1,2-dioxygenase